MRSPHARRRAHLLVLLRRPNDRALMLEHVMADLARHHHGVARRGARPQPARDVPLHRRRVGRDEQLPAARAERACRMRKQCEEAMWQVPPSSYGKEAGASSYGNAPSAVSPMASSSAWRTRCSDEARCERSIARLGTRPVASYMRCVLLDASLVARPASPHS